MSPRHFAKYMISPYFLSDNHYTCKCGKTKKHGHYIRKFIDFIRTPAKIYFILLRNCLKNPGNFVTKLLCLFGDLTNIQTYDMGVWGYKCLGIY